MPHELFLKTRQTTKIRNVFVNNMSTDTKLNNLRGLVSNLNSDAINKFERKVSRKGNVKAGKGFALFILDEEMNDII